MRTLSDFAKAHFRRLWKTHEVAVVKIAPTLKAASHVAIMVVYNEADRLPYLFSYYRRMGMDHFIIIDNGSTDQTRNLIESEPDISLFAANGLYKKSRFGIDWVNHVLIRYCVGKWILHIDADEFLIYPHMDTRKIGDLTNLLNARKQISMPSVMVDMYSERDHTENIYRSGDDPLDVCPLFDREGYIADPDPATGTLWIKGGVRGRIFFPHNFSAGPALNKTPLVKWQPHFAFLKSTHELSPPAVNYGGEVHPENRIRGALLHFKFLSDFSKKVASEQARQQHTNEYDAYSVNPMAKKFTFVGPSTQRYENWQSLQSAGLMSETGQFTATPPNSN